MILTYLRALPGPYYLPWALLSSPKLTPQATALFIHLPESYENHQLIEDNSKQFTSCYFFAILRITSYLNELAIES